MMKILTLKACDACRKALGFLSDNGFEVENHDIRRDGLPESIVRHVVTTAGWEKAVNKRSTTWRKLDDDQKTDLDNEKAIDLILLHPTLMKRPVFLVDDEVLFGFDKVIQNDLAKRFG
ncbi:Spx/MgsR family RNA polymerase-binding regulatory protein [Ahrensia sp. R2A130]|uniref:Spx/MgsR family RNA polymerase-binding regulatory protein n=1 Tax=Ahrensia sp. R2A130 TaxID=744979 RepID=UPI0001E0D11F|nr:Spx/MgsR family RNA polymerase-binding regulatory protein [Ahrensia sp. R2A130]EFL88876.1 chain A, Yffb [Ahrensia sp. R2A130]